MPSIAALMCFWRLWAQVAMALLVGHSVLGTLFTDDPALVQLVGVTLLCLAPYVVVVRPDPYPVL